MTKIIKIGESICIDIDDPNKVRKIIGYLIVAQWTQLGACNKPKIKWCGTEGCECV